MIKALIVPQEDWEILKKYIGSAAGAVLIPETALAQLPEDMRSRASELNNQEIDYDFGGEPDFVCDIIQNEGSYSAMTILSNGWDEDDEE